MRLSAPERVYNLTVAGDHTYFVRAGDAWRWVTRDPIGYEGGINLYAYCGGNPVGRVDPEGLDFIIVGYGPTKRKMVEHDLDELRNAPSHRRLMHEIDSDHKHHIRIQPDGPGADPENPEKTGPHHTASELIFDNNYIDETIFFDPCETIQLDKKGENGSNITGPPDVVLAHEVGHHKNPLDRKDDQLVTPADNVGEFENPFRAWRKLPKRVRY